MRRDRQIQLAHAVEMGIADEHVEPRRKLAAQLGRLIQTQVIGPGGRIGYRRQACCVELSQRLTQAAKVILQAGGRDEGGARDRRIGKTEQRALVQDAIQVAARIPSVRAAFWQLAVVAESSEGERSRVHDAQ
jgi:hypothetical protein